MLLCIEPWSAQTSCLPGTQEAGCPSTVRESFCSAAAEASTPKLESPFFDFSAVFGGGQLPGDPVEDVALFGDTGRLVCLTDGEAAAVEGVATYVGEDSLALETRGDAGLPTAIQPLL